MVPFLWKGALAASSFYDVPSADLLFTPYIQKLYDAHLITGDTENGKETFRYRPDDSLTRAEFTKVAVGVKLAEKYGMQENWQAKSAYEITETVLKDKLLYFHGCDNSDLSNCTSLCGAGICGVCNVCQLINEKPFTDVAPKARDCEEQGVCTPWYSEYIYYALRKGMVQGFHDGSTWSFHPNDPILRLHALKLVMADDGAVDPEADERYRRLSQTAKSRGSYYPKCLSGAENLILNNNGGPGNSDGEKLLKYALLADELDFFGDSCQVFNEKGARTPQARADYLQKPLTRQEVARYFVLSTSYPPLQISAASDPTVEAVVTELKDQNAPKPSDNQILKATNPAEYNNPINQVYPDNIPISQTSPFPSTNNRSACIHSLSTPRLCQTASLSNCITVSDGTRLRTTDQEEYGRTPAGYYTWLWHGVVYNGKTYYTPTDDLDFSCTTTVKASIVTKTVKIAALPAFMDTQSKDLTYSDPRCGVTMSCNPASVSSSAKCGVNMSCKSDAGNDMPWIQTAEIFGKNKGKSTSCSIAQTPGLYGNPIYADTSLSTNRGDGGWIVDNPVTSFVLTTGNWVTENVGKPVAKTVLSVHKFTVDTAETIGNGVKNTATQIDQTVMNGFNSIPDWMKSSVQPFRNQYNVGKGVIEGGGDMVTGVFQIYKDPVGVASGIGKAVSHPLDTLSAIGKGLSDFATESASSQDKQYENAGKAITFIGSFFIGGGEANAASKAAEVADIVTTAGKTADAIQTLNKIEDVGVIARGLEKVQEVSKVSDVLTGMTDTEKAAGILAEMQPSRAAETLVEMDVSKATKFISKLDPEKSDRVISVLEANGEKGLLSSVGRNSIEEIAAKTSGANPLQQINDFDELKNVAQVKKVPFDSKMRSVASEVGARAELADVKTLDAAVRKGAANRVKDIVRGTYVFDNLESLEASFNKIAEKYDIVELKDRIKIPEDSGYRDINMVVRDPDGFLSEVRLSTDKLFEASNKEHAIYEIRRQFLDSAKVPNLASVKKAVETLKAQEPDIYELVKLDTDSIIKHMESRDLDLPASSLDHMAAISQDIYRDAWKAEIGQ